MVIVISIMYKRMKQNKPFHMRIMDVRIAFILTK